MSKFIVGDRVWNLICGDYAEEVIIVTPLLQSESNIGYYGIKEVTNKDSVFPSFAFESNLFKTKEEAIERGIEIREKKIEEQYNSIHDVSDLVKYMFVGLYCNKKVNDIRIEVTKCKAKELLGIEL